MSLTERGDQGNRDQSHEALGRRRVRTRGSPQKENNRKKTNPIFRECGENKTTDGRILGRTEKYGNGAD